MMRNMHMRMSAGVLMAIVLMLLTMPFCEAQDTPQYGERGRRYERMRNENGGKGHCRQDKVREMMQSLKIWKLTEKLAVDEVLAAKLFPRIRELESMRFEMQKEMETAIAQLKDALEKEPGEPDSIESLIKHIRELNLQHMQREMKSMDSIFELLTVEQQANFIIVESEFHDEVRQFLRQRRGKKDTPSHREGSDAKQVD